MLKQALALQKQSMFSTRNLYATIRQKKSLFPVGGQKT